MKKASYIICALFLIAHFLGTSVAAQNLVGSSPAVEVPSGFIATPFGYFHPSCVLQVQKGDRVRRDLGLVQHLAGGETAILPCGFPHYTTSGRAISSSTKGEPAPGTSGWIESESITTNTSYAELTSSWSVPPAPGESGGTVYFFPGFEDDNPSDTVTILQPVLGWNMLNISAWSIASWNCCYQGNSVYSSPVPVNAYDQITGTIQSDCAPGTTGCSNWTVSTYDQTTSQGTTLANTSSYGQTFNWAFGGVLEAYAVSQCSQLPPSGLFKFSAVQVYDYNLAPITTPSWVSENWGNTNVPQCNYSTQASTSEVLLGFGADLNAERWFGDEAINFTRCPSDEAYVSVAQNYSGGTNWIISSSGDGLRSVDLILSDSQGQIASVGYSGGEYGFTASRAPIGQTSVSGGVALGDGCRSGYSFALQGTSN